MPSSFFWNICVRRRRVTQAGPGGSRSLSTPNGSSSVSNGRISRHPAVHVGLPHPQLDLLVEHRSIGIGSAIPPYTPDNEIVPPRRTMSIAGTTRSADRSRRRHHLRRRPRPAATPVIWLRDLAHRRTVRLHPDRVDHRIRATALGQVADDLAEVLRRARVRSIVLTPAAAPAPAARAPGPRRSPCPHRDACAIRVAMSPIGPSPSTTRLPPSGTAAYSTACHAVGSTSDRYTKRSSGGPSGTLIGSVLPKGTRRYSACPPGTWPYSFV